MLTIRTDGQRILDVYTILNPDKLRAVEIAKALTCHSGTGSVV